MSDTHIDSEEALAEFRSTLFSAGSLAPIIDANPATLINAPIGTGKSWLIDDLIDYYLAGAVYKLIVVLAGLTVSLLERRLIRHPVPGVVRLRPRPRRLWPARRILARARAAGDNDVGQTQPLPALRPLSGVFLADSIRPRPASRPGGIRNPPASRQQSPVLIASPGDHAGRLDPAPDRRSRLPRGVGPGATGPERSQGVPLRHREGGSARQSPTRLARTNAPAARGPNRGPPGPRLGISPSDTQRHPGDPVGRAGSNPRFRWCGHHLFAFGKARRAARWRDRRGDVVFVSSPVLGDRTVFFAAGLSADFLRRQLRIERVAEPFASVLCQHRETHFFNLRSLLGAASRFGSNHPQILDLFAMLLLRNISAGRRTLLVSRKHLKRLCADYLERRLTRWGCPVMIVANSGESVTSTDPAMLPLIHYGISGVNSFESFDAVYCLNSYYLDETILREVVADSEPDEQRFPVAVRPVGPDRLRIAGTFEPRHRFSSGDRIARAYHHQLEAMKVIQAVGRVRFATRPREVITFQCGELPGVVLTAEFRNLREAREHFAILSGSEFDRRSQEREIHRLRDEGLTVGEIAQRLEVSERTVYYRLRAARSRGDQS